MRSGTGADDESAGFSELLEAAGDESRSLSIDWSTSAPTVGLLPGCFVEVGEAPRWDVEHDWSESPLYRLQNVMGSVEYSKGGFTEYQAVRTIVLLPRYNCISVWALGPLIQCTLHLQVILL